VHVFQHLVTKPKLCEALIGLSSCTSLNICGRNFINLIALEAEAVDTTVFLTIALQISEG
jgi:hypothetical protein